MTTTPSSRRQPPTVAVLGAGIAGLTAAHELVERGFTVTVYEPRADERAELAPEPGRYPPVKLGGLAASQYSAAGPAGDRRARLRPFPGRSGNPRPPDRPVPGEHGFRFFPAYYLHIWDLLQRIPTYQTRADGSPGWRPTSRTVLDNVRRVVTQATVRDGKPSLIFPREQARSLAELLTVTAELADFGFTAPDVATFAGRLVRFLVTSPLRRAAELQNLSAYDFFVGRDATTPRRHQYTPAVESLMLDMPKVLAAFDSHWGDARTNITTYLQLLLLMDRQDSKADGVLNGPTTEAWFDHWYRHLVELGVEFVPGAAEQLLPPADDRGLPAHQRPRVRVRMADGTLLAPDYVVVAVEAPVAERLTGALRAAGTGGTVVGLDGFSTAPPPPRAPLQPAATRPAGRRDPYSMAETGRLPWDRFQTLAGVQFYFDTEFQLVRGHVFYSGTEWALSSINQHGLWERRPAVGRDAHTAVLSVDIGDFITPSSAVLDEHGRGKAAVDCTADEIATEVWRQISRALTGHMVGTAAAVLPQPVWYTLDRNLVLADDPGPGGGRPVRNEAPYLVPIVGDWPNRPGGEPWNPHGTSWIARPTERTWLADLDRGVWQARHGGYHVHHNSLVFAGTWTRTFTRMTSMEGACESARHAVNAILDHYVWAQSGGTDRREDTTLRWRSPFGFLDQGFSSPVRQPSPAGDYCFVFDIENREPLDTRALRDLDSQYWLAGLPHPLDLPVPGAPEMPVPPIPGGPPMTASPNDYTSQLLVHLQAWRRYLEQAGCPTPAGTAPRTPPTPGLPGVPTLPDLPGPAPVPEPAAPPPASPAPVLTTPALAAASGSTAGSTAGPGTGGPAALGDPAFELLAPVAEGSAAFFIGSLYPAALLQYVAGRPTVAQPTSAFPGLSPTPAGRPPAPAPRPVPSLFRAPGPAGTTPQPQVLPQVQPQPQAPPPFDPVEVDPPPDPEPQAS